MGQPRKTRESKACSINKKEHRVQKLPPKKMFPRKPCRPILTPTQRQKHHLVKVPPLLECTPKLPQNNLQRYQRNQRQKKGLLKRKKYHVWNQMIVQEKKT